MSPRDYSTKWLPVDKRDDEGITFRKRRRRSATSVPCSKRAGQRYMLRTAPAIIVLIVAWIEQVFGLRGSSQQISRSRRPCMRFVARCAASNPSLPCSEKTCELGRHGVAGAAEYQSLTVKHTVTVLTIDGDDGQQCWIALAAKDSLWLQPVFKSSGSCVTVRQQPCDACDASSEGKPYSAFFSLSVHGCSSADLMPAEKRCLLRAWTAHDVAMSQVCRSCVRHPQAG